MVDDIQQIRAFLERLQRRERLLLVVRGLLLALSVLSGVVLLVSVALSLNASRQVGLALAAVGLVATLGTLGAGLLGWKAAGYAVRQARLVEALVPDLRSRLLTAIDWTQRSQERFSQVLLQRSARKARELALQVQPAQVHSPRAAQRAGGGLAAVLVVLLAAGWLLPVGPADALAVLMRGRAAVLADRLANDQGIQDADSVLIGNIVLFYTFPDYTGLDPMEVPNSDGTIHAPPGTRVRITARTAEAFDAVALQVGSKDAVEARLAGGRDIEAVLEVEGEGVYRFLLVRGQDVSRSPDYRIVVDEDAAPVVAVQSDAQFTAPVNQPLRLAWNARDDFGLKRVVLEIEQDGQVREIELRRPLDGDPELSGAVFMTPEELGLSPGSQAKLRVVAYDNDWMAGGKRGESIEMTVDVLGPQAQGRRLNTYIRELRDAMVLVLADYLVEDVPPSTSAPGMLRWAEGARKRYDPIREIMQRQWGDSTPSSIDGQRVSEVMESGARLIRFTVTTYSPGENGRANDQDVATFASLHAEHIEVLEQTIYLLDTMVRRVGLAEVAERAAEVAQEAQELREFAETNPDAAALMARLDQLERLMASLARAAEKLDEGSLKEFVNARLDESRNLMDAIRKAIAEGDLELAQRLLQQLADSLQQMSEGVGNQMSQGQQADDEMAQKMEQLMEDMSALAEEQESLAEQLAEARSKEGNKAAEQAKAWEEVQRLAERAAQASRTATESAGDGAGWRTSSVDRLQRLQDSTDELLDAVRARDARATLERADRTLRQGSIAQAAVDNELTRARPAREGVPDGVRRAQEETATALEAVQEILELMETKLQQQQEESEAMQQLARQLSAQQQQLGERQQQLQRQLQEVEQGLPTADGSAGEAMQQAGEAMQRAEQQLGAGRSIQGEGHQRDAAGRLRSAQEALQQQQQQYQQMQQRMQQMQGNDQGNQEPREDNRDGNFSQRFIEIPAPEDFQTPEEYRRALLEGMEAEVPEEYQALKKRYYEELVRQ